MKNLFLLITLELCFFTAFTQNKYPQDYFQSPLDVPLYLAGNFGEIRAGHFHAGIDLKTQQVEGLEVKAAAAGTVSRIKVSLYGYGKVIYIDHPNGYTTAYAHLQHFNDEIEAYVQKNQYAQKTFEIELFPPDGALKVEQGEVIALSGNTGGSGGPHLHFEIRDSRNSVPLNPLLFGFDIKDNIPPIIKTLAIYPMNDTSAINGSNTPVYLPVNGSNGNYSITNTELKGRGVLSFGLEAIDHLNGSPNRCGVYSIALNTDGNIIYKHEMEEIPFHLTRYINSHVDYYAWNKLKHRVQKSHLDPGNHLNIYKTIKVNGKVFFSKYAHQLGYEVKDAYGNTSLLNFEIAIDTHSYQFPTEKKFILFKYNAPNTFSQNGFSIALPEGALYDDIHFEYHKETVEKYPFSAIHYIQDLYTPLQKSAQVSIPLDSIPPSNEDKLLVISLDEKGELLSPEGGKYGNGSMHFSTRSFGPYTVVMDTISPSIVPANFSGNGKTFTNLKSITFKIEDELSGIASYNGYIDGNWALFEYDRKTGEMSYTFDTKRLDHGKHQAEIIVTDNRGNKTTKTIDFIW